MEDGCIARLEMRTSRRNSNPTAERAFEALFPVGRLKVPVGFGTAPARRVWKLAQLRRDRDVAPKFVARAE